MLALGTAGATISSNKANADPVLTVNNLNTSSTGLLEKWQFNSVNVATLDKTGLFTPSAIGAAVNVTTQAPGANNTTIASMAAVFAERTNTATLTNKTLTTPKLTGYTVATLPAGSIGMEAYVTDAVAPTYLGALTGGGTVVTPVFYNGTASVAH